VSGGGSTEGSQRTWPGFWSVWGVVLVYALILSRLPATAAKVLLALTFVAMVASQIWFFSGQAKVPQKHVEDRLSFGRYVAAGLGLMAALGLLSVMAWRVLAEPAFEAVVVPLLIATAVAGVSELHRRSGGLYTRREWRENQAGS
jgi:hypothetical protein